MPCQPVDVRSRRNIGLSPVVAEKAHGATWAFKSRHAMGALGAIQNSGAAIRYRCRGSRAVKTLTNRTASTGGRVDALLRNHRDGPTLGRAGAIFVHGTNQPRDGRSHKHQRCFLAPILGVASASRLDWIGRFDRLHVVTKGRGTRNSSATTVSAKH
jgi:hypothetical protein